MQTFDLAKITAVAIRTIKNVQREILDDIEDDPISQFEPALLGRRRKPLLVVDVVAERRARTYLRKGLPEYSLYQIGEESLRDEHLDLSERKGLVILMDMVDGTDLLERGLSNWCSALVFYYPPEKRILASFVGLPSQFVYFATEEPDAVGKYRLHVRRGESRIAKVTGPSRVTRLSSASISFYGQQVSHLQPLMKQRGFWQRLRQLSDDSKKRRQKLKTRIYNLAGNPMMMRVIDGHTRIDAVFELAGQAPHDVAPGAFIAAKAGATVCGFDGRFPAIEESLVRPADPALRLRYIVASTKGLARELRLCLDSTRSKA